MEAVDLYPISNYTFGGKNPKFPKNRKSAGYLAKKKLDFAVEGMRRNVAGLLMAHEHGHPVVLVFKIGTDFFQLPGGKLMPTENEKDGLKRKLNTNIAPNLPYLQQDWQIDACVAIWWKPNFDNFTYPYIPPHITKPKECTKLFLVRLPDRYYFEVPSNWKLVAVPLFELIDNKQKYGTVISAIPHHLSTIQFNVIRPVI